MAWPVSRSLSTRLELVRRDQAETSVLFELIAERYERKSIAITANTPFSQWGEVFVDTAMTVAAVDRLVHHSTILEMNVESYRRRAAQAAQAPAKRARATTTVSDGQDPLPSDGETAVLSLVCC